MIEAIEKLETYKTGIVKQFNHINNTISRVDQDQETKDSLNKMAHMIECINKIIKYSNISMEKIEYI